MKRFCALLAVLLAGTLNGHAFVDDDKDGCTRKGKFLAGKVKVVENFADFKVKIDDSFPYLKVKIVEHFADDCGEWQFVGSFPDFTVEFVDSFPDFTIKFVDNFPGVR